MTSPTPAQIQAPRYGEVVRANVGATGVYIGHGLVLYVSAQDNELSLAGIDPQRRAPWDGAPLPTAREASVAAHAYQCGLNDGRMGGAS